MAGKQQFCRVAVHLDDQFRVCATAGQVCAAAAQVCAGGWSKGTWSSTFSLSGADPHFSTQQHTNSTGFAGSLRLPQSARTPWSIFRKIVLKLNGQESWHPVLCSSPRHAADRLLVTYSCQPQHDIGHSFLQAQIGFWNVVEDGCGDDTNVITVSEAGSARQKSALEYLYSP